MVICPGKQHFANLLDSSRPARGLLHTEEVTTARLMDVPLSTASMGTYLWGPGRALVKLVALRLRACSR
jgi:hypothetical protein